MTSETRFSSYILLIQNLFCFLLFHTHTEVYCLNLLPFSFSDINKPCTESCGLHMGNILHLRKLWWESFVPKQEANPSTLLRAQNGIALSSGSFKIMIRHQLTPRKHCAAGRWFPTASAWSLQYRSSSYSQLFGLERWGGYCHTLLVIAWTLDRHGSRGSPNRNQNGRYQNRLARVGTLFPHGWGRAKTTLVKQKTSSLAALSHCSTPSHPWGIFLLVHQYNFKLGLKLQHMIKADESSAHISSFLVEIQGLLPKSLNVAVLLPTTVVFTVLCVHWIHWTRSSVSGTLWQVTQRPGSLHYFFQKWAVIVLTAMFCTQEVKDT